MSPKVHHSIRREKARFGTLIKFYTQEQVYHRIPIENPGSTKVLLCDPNPDLEATRDGLIRNHVDIPTAAARIHGAKITLLVMGQDGHQVNPDGGVAHGIGQNSLPTAHAGSHRFTEDLCIHSGDRIETCCPGLPQLADP